MLKLVPEQSHQRRELEDQKRPVDEEIEDSL